MLNFVITFVLLLRYECKGVQWLKAKPTLPVGLAPEPEKTSQDKPSKSALRRAKKREKKEKSGHEEDPEDQIDKLTDAISELALTNGDLELGSVERHKKLRSLKKKMKQIEELEEQLKNNKSLKLEKEQLEKIQRKAQIKAEISLLEAGDNDDEK